MMRMKKLLYVLITSYIQNAASTSTAKKQLQKLFTSSKQEECTNKWLLTETYATPAAAFEAVKSSVLMDLKADSFKRYDIQNLNVYYVDF